MFDPISHLYLFSLFYETMRTYLFKALSCLEYVASQSASFPELFCNMQAGNYGQTNIYNNQQSLKLDEKGKSQ